MAEQSALTMILAEWAAATTVDELPPEVVHQCKRVMVDYLAATLAGARSASARIVQDLLAETDHDRSATVYGTTSCLSPAGAALANGTAAHAFDVDDGYTPGSYHPGGPVLSAILATAEATKAEPDDVVRAIAVGFELSCRLAGAGHPATRDRGFHNTPIAGVFGAAVGVGLLLGQDATTLASTMGVAGSHAGGLFEFLGQGAEVKRLHAGKAARDGLVSAQLAGRGLTGPVTVLEGANGYIRAFAGDDFDRDHLVGQLGGDWRMLRTYVKPYPCCRHLHGPIDAILRLRDERPIEIEDVQELVIDTYALAAGHDLRQVDELIDAQMSMPYAAAVALVDGEVGLEQFSERRRRDPQIRQVMERIDVRADAELSAAYPVTRPARVTVRSTHGERSLRVEFPHGEPDSPVADVDLEAKLARLAGPLMGADRCRRIAQEVWELTDLQALYGALVGPTEDPGEWR